MSLNAVFIIYSQEDEKAARRLYNDLNTAGLIVWLNNESLLPSQNWKNEIRKAIKNSKYVIALFSSTSVENSIYVQKELKYAIGVLDKFPEADIFVIPARLNNCQIPYDKLEDIEYVDLFPNWEDGIRRILQSFSACGQLRPTEEANTIGSRRIDAGGDVISADVIGSGNVIAKNITVIDNVVEENKTLEKYPYVTFPEKTVIGEVAPLKVIIKAVMPTPIKDTSMAQRIGAVKITVSQHVLAKLLEL